MADIDKVLAEKRDKPPPDSNRQGWVRVAPNVMSAALFDMTVQVIGARWSTDEFGRGYIDLRIADEKLPENPDDLFYLCKVTNQHRSFEFTLAQY